MNKCVRETTSDLNFELIDFFARMVTTVTPEDNPKSHDTVSAFQHHKFTTCQCFAHPDPGMREEPFKSDQRGNDKLTVVSERTLLSLSAFAWNFEHKDAHVDNPNDFAADVQSAFATCTY